MTQPGDIIKTSEGRVYKICLAVEIKTRFGALPRSHSPNTIYGISQDKRSWTYWSEGSTPILGRIVEVMEKAKTFYPLNRETLSKPAKAGLIYAAHNGTYMILTSLLALPLKTGKYSVSGYLQRDCHTFSGSLGTIKEKTQPLKSWKSPKQKATNPDFKGW